jgi:hypothetical protein
MASAGMLSVQRATAGSELPWTPSDTGCSPGLPTLGSRSRGNGTRVRDKGAMSEILTVQAAQELAGSLLRGCGNRWLHTQTAAVAAAEAAWTVAPRDRDLLVAAAWLHDIGYAHPEPPTGFHPVDGALLLIDKGWPRRLASLVAHHSEARFTAPAQGAQAALAAFDREPGPVTDALVYADMTAGPGGDRLRLKDRLEDVRRRHATAPTNLRDAREAREPYLILATARVDVRLRHCGHDHLALPVGSMLPDPHLLDELAIGSPERDKLDLHAVAHAARSLLGTAASREEVRMFAHELLDATQDLPTRISGQTPAHV